ncbi:prepilin peptidase [Lentilactobacillus senioris]|uniref:prepilin peptidase n=1 Tax=Lentilactobacillus senioris TaxID=931534 RepID=UPI002280AB08|nr:A24 family peptidase [Lentilactobacillus senioris]MCY9806618.1 prepilin peptidase [Lentilactobacillus senioris]
MIINFSLGACWASFFNLVIQRQLRHESIIFPASHCDSCNHHLAWYDLIPIISFIGLWGHCRYCHTKIAKITLQTELLLGLVFIMVLPNCPSIAKTLILILFAYLVTWDYHTQTIPSWPLLAWLGIIILIFPWSFNYLKLFPIYLTVIIINHFSTFIGTGDIDILFLLWLTNGLLFTVWVLFLACILAISYLLLRPHLYFHHRIAFLPFLFGGYALTTQFAPQLLTFTIP